MIIFSYNSDITDVSSLTAHERQRSVCCRYPNKNRVAGYVGVTRVKPFVNYTHLPFRDDLKRSGRSVAMRLPQELSENS